jgi:hypothetical protein
MSLFKSLVNRNILPEIFFNCLLPDKDISKLLCTCRDLKEMILKWKAIFSIPKIVFLHAEKNNVNYLFNLLMHYCKNINKLHIIYDDNKLLTNDGYHYLIQIKQLSELNIVGCSGNGLRIISGSLSYLTSLKIENSPLVSSEDLGSISKLTRLERIDLESVYNLNNYAVANYSTLTNLKSIRVTRCLTLSDVGLKCLVANKEFLVQLEINDCRSIGSSFRAISIHYGIYSTGFHCLTTLTNLTNLTILNCYLDDLALNMICYSCIRIEHLCIGNIYQNALITKEGLNNILCLMNLKSLDINNFVGNDGKITKNFKL